MAFRQPPTTARRIGFELEPPVDTIVERTTVGARVRGTKGVIEIEVFSAALVIDRDGILRETLDKAVAALVANHPDASVLETVPTELGSASGYRTDVELPGAPQPHVMMLALAPDDLGVDGGVLVRVHGETAEWPEAEAIVASLRILTRRNASANQ